MQPGLSAELFWLCWHFFWWDREELFCFWPLFGISVIGQYELYRVTKMEDKLLGAVGYAAGAAYYVLLWYGQGHYITLVAIGALMLFMTIYAITFPKYGTEQVTVAFLASFMWR